MTLAYVTPYVPDLALARAQRVNVRALDFFAVKARYGYCAKQIGQDGKAQKQAEQVKCLRSGVDGCKGLVFFNFMNFGKPQRNKKLRQPGDKIAQIIQKHKKLSLRVVLMIYLMIL